jgi:hypothetical protein
MPEVDCIYVAASALDARYTRICVASIRFFYPGIPIRLLVGGRLQRGLADELRKYWDVRVADLPRGVDYGWGFVKLEPLFGLRGERFLVLDSDTVLTGPVLDAWSNGCAPFLVDDEAQPAAEMKAIYYDWERVRQVDGDAQPPRLLFNTGQWFGTSGVLTRDDFAPWLAWSMPRRTLPPGLFMNGEQGILNYVLNRKPTLEGLAIERKQIMRWPARSLEGLDAKTVAQRAAAPRIVHWAGLKRSRQRDMMGGDLLAYFENAYYQRLPVGGARRMAANYQNTVANYLDQLRIRLRLAFHKYRERILGQTPN